MKSDRLFNATYSLIIGLSFIAIAIIILIGQEWIYSNIIDLLILAIFFVAIKDMFSFFVGNKSKRKTNFYKSIIGFTFGIVFSLFKNIPLSILPIAFGLYLAINSIIKIINVIMLFENKSSGKIKGIISFLFDFIIGISCIKSPLKNLNNVLIILSVYLLLLGIYFVKDFITNLIPLRVQDNIKRKTRVSLPAIVEAIIPYTVLNEINYEIDKNNIDKEFIYEEKKDDVEPDLEVLVHISNRGFNRLGHCDIVYNNQVLSYGSYDKKTSKLHDLISDGVVFMADRDKYIPFCIKHSKKTIFAFGLRLTDKQKENIEHEIDMLFKDLKPWESSYECDIKAKKKVNKKDYDDYASNLYMATSAKMYKFFRGKYKKYFVLGNNCVKLADEIIGKSGTDILKMYGVITPGAYYEYLNREFKKKNSMVISRKIYNSEYIKKRKRIKK